jgi:hypothetical protein
MNHELHCAARLSRAGSIPVLFFVACKGESCRIPNKIEGKVRDIVPSLLGSPTFIPELSRMAARYTKE